VPSLAFITPHFQALRAQLIEHQTEMR
jgi:hypothetical protein